MPAAAVTQIHAHSLPSEAAVPLLATSSTVLEEWSDDLSQEAFPLLLASPFIRGVAEFLRERRVIFLGEDQNLRARQCVTAEDITAFGRRKKSPKSLVRCDMSDSLCYLCVSS